MLRPALGRFVGSNSVRFQAGLLFALLLVGLNLNDGVAADIQFNRDIRPILSENCLACHGPDPGSRKAGLRLDTKAGLFEPTEKRGPTVVPGDLEKSELWFRVSTDDKDDMMPPPDSHKELKPAQKQLLKEWILAGGQWEDHWAFIKPEPPEVPETGNPNTRVRNPIDAFVADKLAKNGLQMNPEADLRTLARRLALDLTGLPPTPEQVDAFANDSSPDYFEKFVNQLMASGQWGEHRGRYWLDAARYADTHGLHFDNYREMWPYRDWVINAFNRNEPFDQFVVEQIAGDLLENPTDEQLVATGLQRCNITTNEGGTIEKENLALYANDRVTTTGWVFLGLTTNCAACHDHKFDPFTQDDFYSMAAFFRNTKQSGFDKNWREGDGAIIVPSTDHDRNRWAAIPQELKKAELNEALRTQYADTAFDDWRKQVVEEDSFSTLLKSPVFGDEYIRAELSGDPGAEARVSIGGLPFSVPVSSGMDRSDDGILGLAPVITKEHNIDLQNVTDIDQDEPLSFSAWVYLPKDYKGSGSIIAQMDVPDRNNRGWDFIVQDKKFGIHLVHSWPKVAMKALTEDVLETERWQLLTVTYDGESRSSGVQLFLDGRKVATRGEQNSLEGSIRTDLDVHIGRREAGSELENVALQDVRVYRRVLDDAEIKSLAAAPRLKELFAQADVVLEEPAKPELPDDATDELKKSTDEAHAAVVKKWQTWKDDREALRDYFELVEFAPTQLAARKRLALIAERDQIRARSPYAHIQSEKMDSQPMAKVLMRGQYDNEGTELEARTPGFLPPMPEGAPKNRLGLAQWIVDPENPLAARVAVNRFWQELFGVGLVATPEDFGVVGEPPVNQPLLDWLAVEFVESGWDVKHLFKLMVSSAAYRQDATVTEDKLLKDRDNRLLSRGPRFRMDAEMLRDYALATGGLLVPKIGGPSVKPYQPEGVWEAVAMPESNTRFYEQDHGDALYRRSLYTFWKRAAMPASMDIFNAPSREVCTVKRERTNTPLQALVTLNDPTFVEAARKLAEHALLNNSGNEDAAINEMAERVLLRELTEAERQIVMNTLKEMRDFYESQPEAAKELLSIGESKIDGNIPPARLAALAMVANQLMNLDEALTK